MIWSVAQYQKVTVVTVTVNFIRKLSKCLAALRPPAAEAGVPKSEPRMRESSGVAAAKLAPSVCSSPIRTWGAPLKKDIHT